MLSTVGYYLITWLLWKIQDANVDELIDTAIEASMVVLFASLILGALPSFFTTLLTYNFGAQRRAREEMTSSVIKEAP